MNSSLLLLINGWAGKHHSLDQLMIFLASNLIYVVFAVAVALLVYLLYKRNFVAAAWFMGSLVISFILLKIAAHTYVDHRPFVDYHLTQLIPHAAGSSFPSDHTTVTTAIGLSFLLLTPFKKTGIAIALTAVLIGFARVFVGVHYPIDILGGLVVGTLGSLATWGLMQWRTKRAASAAPTHADA